MVPVAMVASVSISRRYASNGSLAADLASGAAVAGLPHLISYDAVTMPSAKRLRALMQGRCTPHARQLAEPLAQAHPIAFVVA